MEGGEATKVGGVTLPETKILVAPKNGGSRGLFCDKKGG